jgi:hypothetical protein
VDEQLNRSDLQVDPIDNSIEAGFPLVFTVTVSSLANGAITPISGAIVDIWHCNALGIYSDEAAYNPGGGDGTVVTTGKGSSAVIKPPTPGGRFLSCQSTRMVHLAHGPYPLPPPHRRLHLAHNEFHHAVLFPRRAYKPDLSHFALQSTYLRARHLQHQRQRVRRSRLRHQRGRRIGNPCSTSPPLPLTPAPPVT